MTGQPTDSIIGARNFSWTLLGCLVVAALLRFWGVGEQLVLDDEWHALNQVVRNDASGIASSFGLADHSIPLTLYYEWLSLGPGLSEWSMRLPLLLAGIALVVAMPLAMRRWMQGVEPLLFAALLALSPFLIFFSRLARPYALLTLLLALCFPLAWRWWQKPRNHLLLAWWFCAVLCAWLNPVTLAVSLAPGLVIGFLALRLGLREGRWKPLFMALGLLVAVMAATAVLLAWPLSQDAASLAAKSGRHSADWDTLRQALGLFTGSGHVLISLLVVALAAVGGRELWRRDAGFAICLGLGFLASVIAVLATRADWIHQGIVPARYLAGYLPLFLAVVAMGLWQVSVALGRRLGGPVIAVLSMAGFLGVWALTGPLPQWNIEHSQLVNHMANQFEYDHERNPVRAVFDDYEVPAAYARIGEQHPARNALVIETPWYLESFWNPLHLHQAVHGQRVAAGMLGGICSSQSWGEIPASEQGLKFDTLVHVQDLLDGTREADYLVLRRPQFLDLRDIGFDFQACRERLDAAWGEPWISEPDLAVYRLEPAVAESPTR